MKDSRNFHPWELIRYKLMYFPFLNMLDKMPVGNVLKASAKKRLFYDNFAKYARKRFKIKTGANGDPYNVYDMGMFKVCIRSDSSDFPVNSLEWNLSYEYMDIIYPAMNPRYLKFCMGEGPYEIGEVFCEAGDYVLDAGANIGLFSFLSSIEVGETGHVYAVEPIHFFKDCIDAGIKTNSFKNISVLKTALGSDNMDISIGLNKDNPGSSGKMHSSDRSVKIRQTTIDSLVFDKKIPRLNFIKMDIEGAERSALSGGKEAIFKFKPKLSICTYHFKDDPIVLRDIIKKINPEYKIRMGRKKLYAWL